LLRVKDAETVHIRLLEESDPPTIAAAFQNMGWNKPESQYRRYLRRASGQLQSLRYFDLLKNLIAAMTAMSRIKNSEKFDRLMSMWPTNSGCWRWTYWVVSKNVRRGFGPMQCAFGHHTQLLTRGR
jgi:hypothetical protein